MPVDAGSCYPNDKAKTPVMTGFSRGLVGYWREVVVAGLLLGEQQVNGSSPAEDALIKDCTTSTYKLVGLFL